MAFRPLSTFGHGRLDYCVPSSDILSIETNIAHAHRSLTFARDHASCLRDLGLHDDLQLMLIELERLQVDLLRGVGKARVRRIRQDVSQID